MSKRVEINSIVLHLTERCNMRCKYCFMTHGTQNMSAATAEAAVDYLLENCGKYAKVTFFGGEPLLEFDLIRHITDYIHKKTSRLVKLDITTNGTLLTDEFFEYAHQNNIQISLSYDGLLNDANRVNEEKKPLLDIAKHKAAIEKYRITSASVIDVNNVGIWHDNVLHLRNLGFKSMGFFIDYSSKWKSEHVDIMRKEFFKIAETYVQWAKEGNKVQIGKIDDMVRAYLGKFKLSNMRVRRDLVYSIAANGDVYPYASAVGKEALCLGNVQSGINQPLLHKINNLGLAKGCEKCAINDACVAAKGNVITETLEPHVYPIACNGYKIAFDAADYVVNALL
ncbi:MAG: radical SAM protein [Firmicutes bacterium]|nr:radical SAM protein [Bacillota bacterium]